MKFSKPLIVVLFWFLSFGIYAQQTTGIASYYADKFEGRPTASGEKYTQKAFTAAHPSLPFGTVIRVINLENQKEVIVTINDRGPFVKNRILDLSRAAAEYLDFVIQGTAEVRFEILSEGEQNRYWYADNTQFQPTGWGLQLGSFTQRNNALLFARKMAQDHSIKTYIQEIIINNIPHFRVYTGPFTSEQSAESERKRLEKNFPGVLVKAM